MKNEITNCGMLIINDDILVTDPCYDVGVKCTYIVSNLKTGIYNCFIEREKTELSSVLINKALIMTHEDSTNNIIYEDVKDASIGVDSGQLGFFMLNYYSSNHTNKKWYEKVCDITYPRGCGIIDNSGVISQSGFGDGTYRLQIAKDEKGEVISIKVIFLEDNNS